ncbi:hypothetical protein EGR_08852 [Echinococcus granulosus]|uniref:Expressed conserved protein n=1 Tax=Echinococcus granulosus TaxID=6210 RepID=U6JID6_ECHGR|nr:hypothetical protein EGR_08852 [Echinococcus granulosus]EUB56307.1 hypothetical protein EGR_08852 [Echinococcus granulosus]CDS23098.1 expressed conserved protein [Echinococcus granulosus]
MPKKEKSKKEKQDKSSSHEKNSSRKTLHLYVTVCGDPQAIELFTRKNSELNTLIDKYQVFINSEPGNDGSGRVIEGEADFFLCVYDICNRKSVDFLKNKVMNVVNGLKRPIGVAGLGLEYRTRGGKELADVGTAAALAKQYGCKGTELVSCDARQMAAGTFALYAATMPEKFNANPDSKEGGEEGEEEKKKKKSGKKSKKEKN